MIGSALLCVTFDSHYHALVAKRHLGEDFHLAPTPRAVSSSCATCVERKLREGETSPDDDFSRFLSLAGAEGVYVLAEGKKVVAHERE